MACKNCCEDTACCIHSFFDPIPGVRYPLIKTVGVPTIGQCVNLPRGVCGNGFMVPDSPYVWQGTPKNINCERADCSPPPCLCCCEGQCFEVPCDDLTVCTAGGGTVVESCDNCEDYDESLRGACCSQECDGFHCRRMTECECLNGAESAGRRYVHFAGPGTECEVEERCCIDGSVNGEHSTQAACESAGGTWVTGHSCDQYPCGSPPCNCFCDGENPCPTGCTCVDGQCVPPTSETCNYLACVTFEWDLEYLSFVDYPSKNTWIPSTGTATIRCASDSRQLITVSLSSCFGSGATAEVTAPVGYTRADMGPITAVSYSPGSGYAKLGREAPTLTVSGGSGTGLTVTPTVTATNDACGIPTWSVTSVKFSGGTGYANGEALTVTTKAGDTTKVGAALTVQTAPRSQPTLTASVSGGTGATLTPTLASNGTTPQTWGVASVSVSGSTSGYTDGAAVTFSYGANVTEQTKAAAIIKTARTTPAITASASGGSGASLTVTLSQSPTTPSDTALWHVDAVNVANGGTGYANGAPVTFTVTDGTQVTAASGTIVVADRQEPELNDIVAIRAGAGGTYDFYYGGASITANMTPTYEGGLLWWQPTTINILDGGSGYEVGDLLLWAEPYPTLDGSTPNPAYDPTIFSDPDSFWVVTGVDGNGAITSAEQDTPGLYYQTAGNGAIQSVTITSGGDYYKPTGEISRVVVTNPGQYYYYTGVPTGVTIANGGQYYREDASLPPYVAEVTATITQAMPSEGTGAELTVVVDDDTGSATFGQATVSIANGGDGYLAQRTVHPVPLLMTFADANGTQDGNLLPNFPPFDPGADWSIPGPIATSVPGVRFGFAFGCCSPSFLTGSDFYGIGFGGFGIPWPRSGYYEYSQVVNGDEVVTIRGTVTETNNPIWFAEDCPGPCVTLDCGEFPASLCLGPLPVVSVPALGEVYIPSVSGYCPPQPSGAIGGTQFNLFFQSEADDGVGTSRPWYLGYGNSSSMTIRCTEGGYRWALAVSVGFGIPNQTPRWRMQGQLVSDVIAEPCDLAGTTFSGVLYWTYSACDGGQLSSGSVSATLSATVGECP